MKSHSLAAPFFLLFLAAIATASARSNLAGAWEPIKDINDPYIQEIAKFAVTAHDEQSKQNLAFQTVVSGSSQVVAGRNFRLVLTAKDGDRNGNYEAVVWDKPWEKFRKLTSFKALSN